jgi:ribonuclease E
VRSVESTALRVLRGLEEEGEKNRSSAVAVKIANDVAIYILNQKRHELDRIETEHEMEIAFMPAEGLAAGSFEIERTRQRNPADRPRQPQAVGIEAGFAPSDEPEIVEEDVPQEEDEEDVREADSAEGEARSDGSKAEGEDGEQRGARRSRYRSRRRGRRGGRRRNQNQEGGEASAAEAQDGQTDNQTGNRAGDQAAQQPSAPSEQPAAPEPARVPRRAPADADRFGSIADEIDTTPTAGPAMPGKPSAPVWSLSDDIPDTTPRDDDKSAAPSKPARKGWWQRRFGSE